MTFVHKHRQLIGRRLKNYNYETLDMAMPADGVGVLTLNRPAAANAFNTRMGEELRDFWTGLCNDPDEFRCLVVTGTGERAFCAGADL